MIRPLERTSSIDFTDATAIYGSHIEYDAGLLRYTYHGINVLMDFNEIYLPPTPGCPKTTRLSDHGRYAEIGVALARRKVRNSKTGTPDPRVLTRQIYLLRNVLEWLRGHGVYTLGEASQAQLNAMILAYSQHGWPRALDIEERWNAALDTLSSADLERGFNFVMSNGRRQVDGLYQPFWRQQLGWGGNTPLPASAKDRLERLHDGPFSQRWRGRRPDDMPAPRSNVLRNVLTWLNDWCSLPSTVDRPTYRVSLATQMKASRLAVVKSSRVENLHLQDAVTLIRSALWILYDVAPPLLALLREARDHSRPSDFTKGREDWLEHALRVHNLSALVDKRVTRWVASGSYRRSHHTLTVDDLIAAVQGACALVLCAMNARRQREICDPQRGVRYGDLVTVDGERGIYQTNFYIEKTYFDRHVFYVNKSSADALRCLHELKEACHPEDGPKGGDSLFACGRRSSRHIGREQHFRFSLDSRRTHTLSTFIDVCTHARRQDHAQISAHMFRRFFALLYFYRYEHAELRALKQQLRHLDIAMTRVYVTDPASRPLGEQIRNRMGGAAGPSVSQLDESLSDLESELREVEQEKLLQAVDDVLKGKRSTGGFARVVRSLYRRMLPNVEIAFSEASIKDTAERLSKRGYRAMPMAHGQCHSPDNARQLRARCETASGLAKELASPFVCRQCPYHFTNEDYVAGLKTTLDQLRSDSTDPDLPPLQRAAAEADLRNIEELIALLNDDMDANARAIHSWRNAQ